MLYFVVLTLGLLALVAASGVQLSPINIDTANTQADPNPININSPQAPPVNGILVNTGSIIKFVPAPSQANYNLLGNGYILQEVIIHWGSEHQVDGQQFAAEIQFVHLKQGASPAYSIVAVLCGAVPQSPSIVWSQLNFISTTTGSSQVMDISYADLLPGSQGYYQYIGSHTISPYVDVEWFVMEETIDIPEGFLNRLKDVQPSNHARPTTYNPRVLEFP